MKKNRIISLICAALVLSVQVSCGDKPVKNDAVTDTGLNETETTAAASETTAGFKYVYPELDCGGETFTILNNTTNWGFTTDIIVESPTGDILKDTIYACNMEVEENFNVDLKSDEQLITDANKLFINSVLAGDDVYQLTLTPCTVMAQENAFECAAELTQFETLALDMPWWDQSVTDAEHLVTGDELYFAANNISMLTFEDSMCLFMNEDMIENLGLEPLYDKVRDGSWTYDVFAEYCKAAHSLNGDENYAFNESGSAVYGLSTWKTGARALVIGMGNRVIVMSEDGTPKLGLENDRYYTSVERLALLHSTPGECLVINEGGARHYEDVFRVCRAMFTCAQLKASTKYRDMEDSYGIVPTPKFDASQERYYAHRTTNVQLTAIPVTNPKPERAAVIADAMAFLANRDTLRVYWDVNMEHKQLRNEDSIEMLEIISECRTYEIGRAFGWTTALLDGMDTAVVAGRNEAASMVASHRDAIAAMIDASLA